MRNKWQRIVWIGATLLLALLPLRAEELLSEQDMKAPLENIKTAVLGSDTSENRNTDNFTQQAQKQQSDIESLNQQIQTLPSELSKIQAQAKQYKSQAEAVKNSDFVHLTVAELEKSLSAQQLDLQSVQNELVEINKKISNLRQIIPENQKLQGKNQTRLQEISRLLAADDVNLTQRENLQEEKKFIELNNQYNLLLNNHADELAELEDSKRNALSAKQQLLQRQIAVLQEVLNSKRLQETEARAQQIESQQVNEEILNFLIQDELQENKELSRFLLKQTQKLNSLSQDNLRVKSALESLTQTQHNIEEQISALQGTLALSRIINKQKQALPTETLNKDLSKTIAELRVDLFEYSQQRDELHGIDNYIQTITQNLEEPLTSEELSELDRILQERYKILDDIVKSLNSELNLAINIEGVQRQVIAIGDGLQEKLQQQSFWVKSNNPLNLEWIERFPTTAVKELSTISHYIGFANNRHFTPILSFMAILSFICALILWKKETIKQRLNSIASRVNTLKNDSHWLSPEAMMWTLILAVPSMLMFTMAYGLIVFFFLDNPLLGWQWGMKLSLYWLFFASVLALLRRNGIAYRHFGMPQESNAIFHRIIRHSIWIVSLLVVSSVPTQVEQIGFADDVIGQVMTIVALALCLFVVRPLLDRGITEYGNSRTEDGAKRSVSLFKLLRIVLIVVPIVMIILIMLGYYYTAVYLIEHLLNSYFVALIWVFGRYFAYRSVTISARRMAYRRLQAKREKLRETTAEHKDELKQEENKIKLSVLNKQIFQMTDLVGWVILFAMLYVIWSDLLSVANYLNNVILWESVDGTQVESITLFSLLRAILYVVVTVALVKNLAGILAVTFFSRVKLSRGTPQTITAILSYIIIVVGSFSAFTALGISWSKIQWIFTALSVGLGFGVREIFGSFVSGSILLFERPIRVGDKVTVAEHTGIITKIRLRSTTLINSDNMEVVLPNQAFVTGRFINWTLNNTITRLQILFKVHYGADLELVRELLWQAVSEAPKVLADPKPEINILHFGDNALEHELIVFVGELADRTETNNFLHYRVNELFKQHQIRFAFKQLDVHLYNEENNAVQAVEKFAKIAN